MKKKDPKQLSDSSSSSSAKKKKATQQPQSIIPDYLLKQVEELHKKEGASPKILKQDKHNRQKSGELRKQRERKYKE